jgi:hypothetical protein
VESLGKAVRHWKISALELAFGYYFHQHIYPLLFFTEQLIKQFWGDFAGSIHYTENNGKLGNSLIPSQYKLILFLHWYIYMLPNLRLQTEMCTKSSWVSRAVVLYTGLWLLKRHTRDTLLFFETGYNKGVFQNLVKIWDVME